VAAALRAGLKTGRNAFVEYLAQQFFANQAGNQTVTLQHATLVLVAEHHEHGIVGALVAFPRSGSSRACWNTCVGRMPMDGG